jgi:hypothetical protein
MQKTQKDPIAAIDAARKEREAHRQVLSEKIKTIESKESRGEFDDLDLDDLVIGRFIDERRDVYLNNLGKKFKLASRP